MLSRTMKFSEFTQQVDTSLTVDADRRATSQFKDRQILNAIWDLQFYIKAYRSLGRTVIPFETAERFKTCNVVDMSTLGPRKIEHVAVIFRSEGCFDDIECYSYKIPCCKVLDQEAYEMLYLGSYTTITDLMDGTELVTGFAHFHDTLNNKLYSTPQLTINQSLEILWDSYQHTFTDDDEMPWFQDVVHAVSLWVKAHIAREVNEDLQMYSSYMAEYLQVRSQLFLQSKDLYGDLDRQKVIQLQNFYIRPTEESFDDPGSVILFDSTGEPITISL